MKWSDIQRFDIRAFMVLGMMLLAGVVLTAFSLPRVEKRDPDTIEARLTVMVRLELSAERAKRLWPDLNDPASAHSRRQAALYDRWKAADDERLLSTDVPYLLARETANPDDL